MLRSIKATGADLSRTTLVNADLRGASLGAASLVEANLDNAIVEETGVIFGTVLRASCKIRRETCTDVSGANLATVRGLTQRLLDQACGDASTKLPKGLTVKPCNAPAAEPDKTASR